MSTAEQKTKWRVKAKARYAAKRAAMGLQVKAPSGFTKMTLEEKRTYYRARQARRRAENPDRVRQITRESMKRANDARAIAKGWVPGIKGRRAIPRTPEEKRARQNARVKRYYAENIGKTRPYGAVLARNRRAKLKEVGGTHTIEDILYLRTMQKDKCTFCLQMLGAETPDVDHHLPLSLGGTNDRKNLHLLHKTCNRMKSSKHPITFAQQNGLLCW